jgi:hypothetical protein
VVTTHDGRVTVSGKGDGTRATVESGDATVTYGGPAVPHDFPAAVPLPKGMRLRNVAGGSRAGSHFFQLDYSLGTGTTAAALNAAVTAYRKQLDAAGFTVTATSTGSAPFQPLRASGHGWNLIVLPVPGTPATLGITVTDS